MGFWDRLGDAVVKFVETLTIKDAMPAAVLFLMFTAFAWMMVRAQRKPGFNIEQIFLDDNGKPSMGRLLTAWCFFISGWVIMTLTYWDKITENYFFGFMIVFVCPSMTIALGALIMAKARQMGVNFPDPQPPPAASVTTTTTTEVKP